MVSVQVGSKEANALEPNIVGQVPTTDFMVPHVAFVYVLAAPLACAGWESVFSGPPYG